jgi:hypothetical protein
MYVQQYQRLFIAFLERSHQAWLLSCDNFFQIVIVDRAKNCETLTRWPLVKSSETACKNLSGGKSVRLLLDVCANVMDVGEGIASETAIKLMHKEIP